MAEDHTQNESVLSVWTAEFQNPATEVAFRRLSVERAYNRTMRDEIEARRQLEIRLKAYATTDHLTGILNRRQFMKMSTGRR